MRKRTIQSDSQRATATIVGMGLDLTQIASVEVTSEQSEFPIESVFAANASEWRADRDGEQVIRLIFDEPTSIHLIQLGFVDSRSQRTQEFTLSYMADGELREIVRQQWTFNPDGCHSEFEDYKVELAAVRSLELRIQPDLQHHQALANLSYWRVHA